MASEEWLKGHRWTQRDTAVRLKEASEKVRLYNQKAHSAAKLLEAVIRSMAIEDILRLNPDNLRLLAKRREVRQEIQKMAENSGFDREEFLHRLTATIPEAGQPSQIAFLCDVLGIK